MFPIYDVETAQKTILKRSPLDEMPIPQQVLDRLKNTFGREISPAEAVREIIRDIRTNGNSAVRRWTQTLDQVNLADFRIPSAKIQNALNSLDPALRQALETSASRIEQFYQKQPAISWLDQSMGGSLGQMLRPMERVGIYVPGGTAPLPSTVLMTAIPARVAGVKQVVMVTPPGRGTGEVNPVILAAAAIADVDEVYAVGGAQAIAALAYGTETITRVDKIVGPGNLFVTLAKQQVFGTVGIDGLAGPTETIVIADETTRPDWAAADLLAQAEHDVMAAAILLTPSKKVAQAVQKEMAAWLEGKDDVNLTRTEIFNISLRNRSGAVITRDIAEAVELSNQYGPEHLNLAVKDPWNWVEKVTCSGGVFIGETSCEVMGDYMAGPSHVMPTGGSARFASPLNVWDFLRIISVIGLNPSAAADLGCQADILARAEGLDAHALAGRLRSA
ncbi:histidinol dehydrogenase [Leptolinea tardivitalis]|uniref:Histidinol dehydrogenase n=1 Tax=Leptolinea tardivitalis TaxID=229920 RepID=A0A0P6X752_9CHLR|nr:histidinol dehydrogenase [Leptolinea tardivitalis]KPL70854.1 histidinol dehydrogenase [Leptolinea tardivitalis]GAP20554.1 histidinol dehydrogenase [Leptolinea tardivitalis]